VPGTAAVLAREVRRLADRYRHLPESRLNGRIDPDDPADPARSRADAGLVLARRLAALGDAPTGSYVPDLGGFAVGDQIAVTGLDLVDYAESIPDTPKAAEERSAAATVLEDALRAVRELAVQV
jgi:hypothetical protein